MKAGGNQAAVQLSGRSGRHHRGLIPSSTEYAGRGREGRKHVVPSFRLQITCYASRWLNQVGSQLVRHCGRCSFCDEQSGKNSWKEAESSLSNNPYKILFLIEIGM